MIETKILGDAVGVQRGDVIDNSETTVLPSLANGVITGHFKRGRMDKPFKVTSSNYRSLLGYDPSNPSYLAVEDAFKRGISEISILRVGGMAGVIVDGGSGDGVGGGTCISKSTAITDYSNTVQPDFTAGCHARWRINNGAWIDYVDNNGNENWRDKYAGFFKTVVMGEAELDVTYYSDGRPIRKRFYAVPLINTGGGGVMNVDTQEDGKTIYHPEYSYTNTETYELPTPFILLRSYGTGRHYLAAAGSEPSIGYILDDSSEVIVPSINPTNAITATIEFVMSDGIGIDLVEDIFGGNTIINACSFAVWEHAQ